MNRLLLTAATALTMAVSSHASAASYVLDSFEGANSLYGGADPFSNMVVLEGVSSTTDGGIASYSSSGFTFSRSVLFEQTDAGAAFDNYSILAISGADQEEEPNHYAVVYIQNYPDVNSKLTLTYDIGSIDGAVGSGAAAFNLSVVSTEANIGQEVYIDAILNGNAVGTWELNSPVVFYQNPSTNHTFNISGAQLTGSDQLSFVVRGASAYNLMLSPLTFDVLPVPEPGEWAMMGAGLLVAGFAARRRRIAA